MNNDVLPYISVLLPSRGRPAQAQETGDELLALAEHPDDIEILLGLDQDDPALDRYVGWGIKLIHPERFGYSRLHEYYNSLAKLARGEWNLLWNDDVRMTTVGWDNALRRVAPDKLIADLESEHSAQQLCCFPAVRHDAILAVGGFSPHTCHCDTYWQDVGRNSGRIVKVPIVVNHQRFDVTGHNNDQTYQESKAGYRSDEFYGPVVQAAIAQDTEIIRRLP